MDVNGLALIPPSHVYPVTATQRPGNIHVGPSKSQVVATSHPVSR